MKRVGLAFLAAVAVLLSGCGGGGSSAGGSSQDAVYVDSTKGNDTTGTGTVGSPFKTITKALKAPNLGQFNVIRLAPGTYNAASTEVFPIVLNAASIQIVGTGGAPGDVVVTGGTGDVNVFDVEASGCSLMNFTTISTYTAGKQASTVYVFGDNTKLEKMTVVASGGGGLFPNAVEIGRLGITTTITTCSISATSAACVYLNAAATLNLTATSLSTCSNGLIMVAPSGNPQAKVRGCTFDHPSGAAVLVLAGIADLGTTTDPGNNTFLNTSDKIDLHDSRTSGAKMEAVDNVFSHDPPECGVNILVSTGAGGWHWRVKGGSGTEGNCP